MVTSNVCGGPPDAALERTRSPLYTVATSLPTLSANVELIAPMVAVDVDRVIVTPGSVVGPKALPKAPSVRKETVVMAPAEGNSPASYCCWYRCELRLAPPQWKGNAFALNVSVVAEAFGTTTSTPAASADGASAKAADRRVSPANAAMVLRIRAPQSPRRRVCVRQPADGRQLTRIDQNWPQVTHVIRVRR